MYLNTNHWNFSIALHILLRSGLCVCFHFNLSKIKYYDRNCELERKKKGNKSEVQSFCLKGTNTYHEVQIKIPFIYYGS